MGMDYRRVTEVGGVGGERGEGTVGGGGRGGCRRRGGGSPDEGLA